MGRKVHPFIFRIGSVTNWRSRWFSKSKYRHFLEQDVKLREFLNKKLDKAGVNSIEIERSANSANIIVKTARPGLIIGRGGSGAEDLKREIKKFLKKCGHQLGDTEIRLEIEEVKQPTAQAALVGQEIAGQIERRMPYEDIAKAIMQSIRHLSCTAV